MNVQTKPPLKYSIIFLLFNLCETIDPKEM